jgi:hypothetical protein
MHQKGDFMKIIFLIIGLMFFSGCISQVISKQEHIDAYVGSSIEGVRDLYKTPARRSIGFSKSEVFGWDETISQLSNEDQLYSFSNPYLDCKVEWIANKTGTILSGSYSGEDCK